MQVGFWAALALRRDALIQKSDNLRGDSVFGGVVAGQRAIHLRDCLCFPFAADSRNRYQHPVSACRRQTKSCNSNRAACKSRRWSKRH